MRVYTAHFNNLHIKYNRLIQFTRKNVVACTNGLVKIHTIYLVGLQADPNENALWRHTLFPVRFDRTVFEHCRDIFSDGFDKTYIRSWGRVRLLQSGVRGGKNSGFRLKIDTKHARTLLLVRY